MLHGEHLDQWDVALSEVMFSYNTSVHTAPGFTPQFLMFGEEGRVTSEVGIGIASWNRSLQPIRFGVINGFLLPTMRLEKQRHVHSEVRKIITTLVHIT